MLARAYPIIAAPERNAQWDNEIVCRPAALTQLVSAISSFAAEARQFSVGERMLAVALASCSAAEGLGLLADSGLLDTQGVLKCAPDEIARVLRRAADVYDAIARSSRS